MEEEEERAVLKYGIDVNDDNNDASGVSLVAPDGVINWCGHRRRVNGV